VDLEEERVLKFDLDFYKDEIVQNTIKLLQIKSVESDSVQGKPFGEGVNDALLFCLNLAEELGFRTGNVDGYAGYAEIGEGDETLAILVHLDVVPEGVGWTYPPYGAEIHNGKIYARGAIDDKGPAIAALYAMKAVFDSKLKMQKKVRIIFGLDEESGWKDMEYYFQKEPMPEIGITPDGCYPVIYAEKGIIDIELKKDFSKLTNAKLSIVSINGGERANMVPDKCECVLSGEKLYENVQQYVDQYYSLSGEKIEYSLMNEGVFKFVANGISAHGSTPDKGKNAISIMLDFLNFLGFGESDIERYLKLLFDKIGYNSNGEGMNIDFEDESGDLTLNLGTIVLNKDFAKAVINIRYPVTFDREEMLARIRENCKVESVNLEIKGEHAPLFVSKDNLLVKTLIEVYEEQTQKKAEPIAIGGGTYARALKNGVAFGAMFPGSPELAHQKDEYIEIEDLILNAKIYAHAISRLCI